MENENKLYQLSCHISPLLDQNELENLLNKINTLITEKNGSVLAQENLLANNLQRKKLGFPIKKFSESLYLNLNFLLPNEQINKLSRELNLEKNIIRHMLVVGQKPVSTPKEIIDYKASKQIESLSQQKNIDNNIPAQPTIKPKKQKTEENKKEKVKLEDLDQKLEEILNA